MKEVEEEEVKNVGGRGEYTVVVEKKVVEEEGVESVGGRVEDGGGEGSGGGG